MFINCSNCKEEIEYKSDYFCPRCAFLNYVPSKESQESNYFQYLGLKISIEIDLEKLEQQYLKLIAKYHPDNFVNKNTIEQKNSLLHSSYLNEAYSVLKDAMLRVAYCYYIEHQSQIVVEEKLLNSPIIAMEFFELYEKLENISIDTYQDFIRYLNDYRSKIFAEIKAVDIKNQKEKLQNLYIKIKYLDRIKEKAKIKKIKLI